MKELQSCLKLFEGETNDEQQFAGLCILPRVLDASNLTQLTLAIDRLPWTFLRRLLKTSSINEMSIHAVHSIPLQIWSVFVMRSEFRSNKEMLKMLPFVLDVLSDYSQSLCTQYEWKDNAILIIDALNSSVSCVPPQIWTQSFLMVLVRLVSSETVGAHSAALLEALLLHWMNNDGCKAAPDLLRLLATVKHSPQDSVHFLRLSVMAISICSPQIVVDSHTLLLFKRMLRVVFRNKLTVELRDLSLSLCAMLISQSSGSFITTTDMTGVSDSNMLSETAFVTLLAHITCAEIRVLLDETSEVLPASDSSHRLNTMLPLCFDIIESIISFLVTASDDNASENGLSHDSLLSIRNALSSAFLAVSAFLSERWDIFELSNNASSLDNLPTIGSLKSYATWVAQDTVPETDLIHLTPLILWFSTSGISCIPNVAVCSFLIPVFFTLCSNDKTAEFFVSQKGHFEIIRLLTMTHNQSPLTPLMDKTMESALSASLLALLAIYPDMIGNNVLLFGEYCARVIENPQPLVSASLQTALVIAQIINTLSCSPKTPSYIVLPKEKVANTLKVLGICLKSFKDEVVDEDSAFVVDLLETELRGNS